MSESAAVPRHPRTTGLSARRLLRDDDKEVDPVRRNVHAPPAPGLLQRDANAQRVPFVGDPARDSVDPFEVEACHRHRNQRRLRPRPARRQPDLPRTHFHIHELRWGNADLWPVLPAGYVPRGEPHRHLPMRRALARGQRVPTGGRRSKPSARSCSIGETRFAALRAACRPEVGVPSRPRASSRLALRPLAPLRGAVPV